MTMNPNLESAATEISRRTAAWIAGLGLVLMGILGPFALLGVLQDLLVPTDAAATMENIAGSLARFRGGIAALLIVVMLDVVVAWALYVVLEPVNRSIALLTGWLRLGYAAMLAASLTSLLDVAQLLGTAEGRTLPTAQLEAEVATSLMSFHNGFEGVALAVFGLHLFGLGYLVYTSVSFPRFLGVLVVIAGGGYVVDAFGTILIPEYGLSLAAFTFGGEALLIFWLLWRATKGFGAGETPLPLDARGAQPQPVRS